MRFDDSEVDQVCDSLIIDCLIVKVELQWNLNLSLTKNASKTDFRLLNRNVRLSKDDS